MSTVSGGEKVLTHASKKFFAQSSMWTVLTWSAKSLVELVVHRRHVVCGDHVVRSGSTGGWDQTSGAILSSSGLVVSGYLTPVAGV